MTVNLTMSPPYAQFSEDNWLPERFERKFYIGPRGLGMAYGLLHRVCVKDTDFYSEQINSLYFDTIDLDQHQRSDSGDYRKDKIRIRWYGAEPDPSGQQIIYVELKSRQGFSGTKQRHKMKVPVEKLRTGCLHHGIIPRSELLRILAGYGYFPSGILIPVVRISYWRYRFTESGTGQRVSLDCHIRSTMIQPCPNDCEKDLELPGAVIEIKGDDMELPVTLMEVQQLCTDWTRFSKYSASIDARSEEPGSIGRMSPSGKVVR